MKNSITEELRRASKSETTVSISLRILKNEKIHCQRFYHEVLVGKIDDRKGKVTLYVKDGQPVNTMAKRIELIQRICEVEPV